MLDRHAGRLQRIVIASAAALLGAWSALGSWSGGLGAEETLSAAGREWFEKHIRPVLVERCYECHNTVETQEGGLALDHRQALRDGGFSGPAVKPGEPAASLLLRAIRQQGELRMPQDGPQLEPPVVRQFEQWIAMGAPDPRDAPPTAAELEAVTSWPALREKRKQWWSFQPVSQVDPPPATDWSDHPVDRFTAARMQQAGLSPARPATRHDLIRRLSYVLTGLPPTPEQIEAFVTDPSPTAYQQLVDRLLESPEFGERWARHWLDWVRYAESHGSEGDPQIPMAWRYRDYLIRAWNQDVPYDQLIREHLAGDRLAEPRLSSDGKTNESMLGIAHYRFVQHGYAPTDALDEQVRFTDNQIDVISKAFLGMTVSCARCHDHKFDAISQADFYALYGVLISCRPAVVTIDSPRQLERNREQLQQLKVDIRKAVAEHWLQWIGRGELRRHLTGEAEDNSWAEALQAAVKDPLHPLHAWTKVDSSGEAADGWKRLLANWTESRSRLEGRQAVDYALHWQLAPENRKTLQQNWPRQGSGFNPELVSQSGAFTVSTDPVRVISSIYPSGVYSHLISNKHSALLTSPDFDVEMDELWVRVLGGNMSRVRYAMQHYPRVAGPVYKAHDLKEDRYQWFKWDMRYWHGDQAYLELATAADLPVEARSDNARSWFGISEVVGLQRGQPAPQNEPFECNAPLLAASEEQKVEQLEDLVDVYEAALAAAIRSWNDGTMRDEQARFLNGFVQQQLLPNRSESMASTEELVRQYQQLEQEISVPRRAPGVIEGQARDQALFVRGNHKQPSTPVPRRFLEALDGTPFAAAQSGRLQLAEQILDPENPFTSRVIANRIWHHVFGRGIVRSTDNFGRLGDAPTHPQLLDYLATTLHENHYSLKSLIRLLVTSKTFQQSTVPSPEQFEQVLQVDPGNVWWSHMPVRRLEAEAIRDTLLAVSGQLDLSKEGQPAAENSRRRSIYVGVRRNSLSPFLEAFDAPVPFTTKGTRNVTNVPAQSLTLMNDAFVQQLARAWAARILADPGLANDRRRIERMYLEAMGRPATANEVQTAEEFLSQLVARRQQAVRELAATRQQIQKLQQRMQAIEQPARKALLAKENDPRPEQKPLKPLAEWRFEEGLSDQLGGLAGKAVGSARVEDGSLVLDGQSFVMTQPLKQSLRAKTLEAWVQLDDIDQQAGGVMTIQTLDGNVFDSVVYAERESRKWMAGSNFFQRTQNVEGPKETERVTQSPMHVAVVYAEDGTIAVYRDGRPYGQPYSTDGPVTFEAEKTQVLFGLRHGTPGSRRGPLRGAISQARLYDRALAADEIAASAAGATQFVSRQQVRNSLAVEQRAELEAMDAQLAALQTQVQQLAELAGTEQRNGAWQDLAHALFNFKEFIYLR